MSPMALLVLCTVCGGLVAAAIWLLAQTAASDTGQKINARLAQIDANASVDGGLAGEDSGWLTRQFWLSGVNAKSNMLLHFGELLLFLGVIIGLFFGWVVGFVTALVIPAILWLVLKQRGAQRGARMARQLPAFLEHMQRSLLAGNSFEKAFADATAETEKPLRQVTDRVTRQVHMGVAIEAALGDAAELSQRKELATLALAARVNRRFGGSPRAMLGSIIQLIRQQENAGRELRALTAETRFSAVVLAAIPIGITAFILFSNPGFYTDMWASTSGRGVLIGAGVLQCLGVLAIWRMISSVDSQ